MTSTMTEKWTIELVKAIKETKEQDLENVVRKTIEGLIVPLEEDPDGINIERLLANLFYQLMDHMKYRVYKSTGFAKTIRATFHDISGFTNIHNEQFVLSWELNQIFNDLEEEYVKSN